MDKKIIGLLFAMMLTTGCASIAPIGGLLTDVTVPINATSSSAAGKKGVAKCTSILALVATGDCSIEAAKRNGKITQVSHVDWKANNILGIIGNYQLIVYGK